MLDNARLRDVSCFLAHLEVKACLMLKNAGLDRRMRCAQPNKGLMLLFQQSSCQLSSTYMVATRDCRYIADYWWQAKKEFPYTTDLCLCR